MKILVTGSSGLIGSSICSLLREEGFQVVTMDIRPSPNNDEEPSFGDILDSYELSKAINNVDGLIHLAGVSRVIDGQKNPEKCLRLNVAGLASLIRIMKRQPHQPWIIYASSREVYGEPEYLPVDEDHPLNPINVYGESKKTAETMLTSATKSGIASIIFRLSNVYGSIYDYPTRVIPAFLIGAINRTPLRIDSPNYVFDFTHVRDVSEATAIAVKAASAGEFDGTNIFNLSLGKGTRLKELVGVLEEITGKELTTLRGEQRNFDVARYVGNCSKLETRLGYRCQIQLKEGLKLMYNDYMNNRRAQN